MMELAQMLQTYGAWGCLVIACGAIAWLAKAYIDVRDNHDKELKEIAQNTTKLVERCTEVITIAKGSMERVVQVLDRYERRLEDVERKIDR